MLKVNILKAGKAGSLLPVRISVSSISEAYFPKQKSYLYKKLKFHCNPSQRSLSIKTVAEIIMKNN